MRLSKQEISGIIRAMEDTFAKNTGELRLYGSRIDDTKKGGDIDLLLIVSNKKIKRKYVERKHEILAQMKNNIGDRKIDILICQEQDIDPDPFISLIYPSSIILKKW